MPETPSSLPVRLFIALPVPEPVKTEIEKAQAELRHALPGNDVRWTKRGQFHLTLRFLGNVDSQKVGALGDSLRAATQTFAALQLRAGKIGFFPDARSPRVIWVSVQDKQDTLTALQAAVESAVARFTTEAAEKRFIGHITLGRGQGIKRPQAELLAKAGQGMAERILGEWTAEQVELIRSELGTGGSRYTVLDTAPLLK